MEDAIKLKKIYEEAYNFLKARIDENTLRKHLDYYHNYKPTSMNDVFKQMVQTLKNKQGYTNFIADVGEMADILYNYDPKKTFSFYSDKWDNLFLQFQKKYRHKYKMDINNKRNAWVMFTKGILSCSKFLSKFDNIVEFDNFVTTFSFNEYSIAALPMLLEKEIYGYGFPLACDFLKELGYTKYCKPDVHLKDIFAELNLIESKSDYEVFKKIVEIGNEVGEEPVIVDKVFWLIGSGKFHFSDINIGSQKKAFIGHIRNALH